mmetsp:Transcript_21651/g.63594  ORF Transcript_21651/g.63594 Transcript_21651/m.63594 type:complete len:273 (-) Transcript_21651:1306-2124(-)
MMDLPQIVQCDGRIDVSISQIETIDSEGLLVAPFGDVVPPKSFLSESHGVECGGDVDVIGTEGLTLCLESRLVPSEGLGVISPGVVDLADGDDRAGDEGMGGQCAFGRPGLGLGRFLGGEGLSRGESGRGGRGGRHGKLGGEASVGGIEGDARARGDVVALSLQIGRIGIDGLLYAQALLIRPHGAAALPPAEMHSPQRVEYTRQRVGVDVHLEVLPGGVVHHRERARNVRAEVTAIDGQRFAKDPDGFVVPPRLPVDHPYPMEDVGHLDAG